MNFFAQSVIKFTGHLIHVGLNSLLGTWKPRASIAFLAETFVLEVH